MKLNKFISFVMLIFFTSSISAQSLSELIKNKNNGYKIVGEITGLKDTTVMLAYYFGGKQYATDTANVVNGKFIFKGKNNLKGGMYLVVLSNQRYFDIIISEQRFSFKTDVNSLISSMSFSNSKENTPFYEYINFISKKRNKMTILNEELNSNSSTNKENIKSEIKKINFDVNKYKNNFLTTYPDIFFSKIIRATNEIKMPDTPLDSTGKPDQNFQYRYYKKHFWDNIDFSDERILRTPLFYNKLDQYLDKLTYKNADSINTSCDVLVELSRENYEIFKYIVSYITSTYERSKIMGMDAVFVHMVEKYYLTNQCDWVDSIQLKKIADRAQKIAPNLIGRKAAEFVDFYGRAFMKDINGNTYTLNDVSAKYTVLVFFGPTCGHCKKEIPKIKHNIDSLINIGLNIKTFSVATEFDKEEWKKFITDQKIEDWINVADISFDKDGNPVASSDWRDKYDIYSTPVIYLLDENKKIIAKRITYKQITNIISMIEKES